MQIRVCTVEDVQPIIELLAQLWPDIGVHTPAMRQCVTQGLQSENQAYLCAVRGRELVAFGSLAIHTRLWQQGQVGYVDNLIVHHSHRLSGVGTALLRELERVATQAGCKRLELDSAHHRAKSHRFYETLGYENRGIVFSKILSS